MLVTETPDAFLGVPTYIYGIQLLDRKSELLHKVWALYKQEIGASASLDEFTSLVESLIDECHACSMCQLPTWHDDCSADVDGDHVCTDCRDECHTCERCGEFSGHDDYVTWVVGDYAFCEGCLGYRASYCEHCDEYYLDDDHDFGHEDEDREPQCDCSPRELKFTIPANSHGVLSQDERLLVELPAGSIDERTVSEVARMIWLEQVNADGIALHHTLDLYQLIQTIETIEPVWSTTRGSYTKRLSKTLYQQHGIKVVGELMSRIGTLVRERANDTASWHIEFTRDVNHPDHHFGNSGSCWWGCESQSLCALKSWGGIGLRSYESADQPRERPSGRAWVQPLGPDFLPTRDALEAHAYLVYNCYGDLSGYTSARLMAYLASRSYRKVEVDISSQYVNNCNGYLIADQATCEAVTHIGISLGDHEVVAA